LAVKFFMTYKIVDLYLLFIWTISVCEIYHKKMIHIVFEAKQTPLVTETSLEVSKCRVEFSSRYPYALSRVSLRLLFRPSSFSYRRYGSVVGTTKLNQYFDHGCASRHTEDTTL